MPKSMQPASLQKTTFDALLMYFVGLCDQLSRNGDLNNLRRSIAMIREFLFPWLPPSRRLLAEFCSRFVDEFYKFEQNHGFRPESHVAAALEMIMDVDFVGLRCGYYTMRCLDDYAARRIRGLEKLDITMFGDGGMSNFRLHDLTELYCQNVFNDDYLAIVGSQCFKLRILDIRNSWSVTDKGLRAIHRCSELRVLYFYVTSVSAFGLNEMLSSHKKIREFHVNFDILSRPKSLTCPSMKQFCLKSDPVNKTHIRAVVAIFPNLTHIEFESLVVGDLRELQALKNLERLDFSGLYPIPMDNLKQLLTVIGENISCLKMMTEAAQTVLTENDLRFLHKTCKNIQILEFEYRPRVEAEKLTIPTFPKLKNLKVKESISNHQLPAVLELGEVLELEILDIQGFGLTDAIIESMMFDHVKFPKLRLIRTSTIPREDVIRLNRIATQKNLDFSIEFDFESSYDQFWF